MSAGPRGWAAVRLRSGLSLALANAGIWLVVVVATQRLVRPALPVGVLVTVGVVLTTLATLGYASVLRGPAASTAPRTRRSGTHAVADARPLRAGLTADGAARAVRLLADTLECDGVALTDTDQVLAYTGIGQRSVRRGVAVSMPAIQRVLAEGRTVTTTDRSLLTSDHLPPTITAATVCPVQVEGHVVGALAALRVDADPPFPRLVEAIAQVLGLQLELAEVEEERRLAATAKLDALRAQINPHFLFNTLNTIASKARTDPEQARELLLRLSDFFRYSVRQQGQFAEFGQEYFFVRTYLSLEQARFGERLEVVYEIEPQVLTAQVPVLVIQPLVENAVKHGLAPKVEGGTVRLEAATDPIGRTTRIRVSDTGVGMDADVVAALFDADRAQADDEDDDGQGGSGLALRNIAARLGQIYGERHSLQVASRPGGGTTVELRIPQS